MYLRYVASHDLNQQGFITIFANNSAKRCMPSKPLNYLIISRCSRKKKPLRVPVSLCWRSFYFESGVRCHIKNLPGGPQSVLHHGPST